MNYVAANQEIFLVEEILAPTRPALDAAIFVSNCGRSYEWHQASWRGDDAGLLEKLGLPMQCAAIMAPELSARTSESLKIINAAIKEIRAAKAAVPEPASAESPVLVPENPLTATA
jgi:hypothetical protein